MELMINGVTGIVFPAGDVSSLVGAINELGTDHGKRARFSAAAREHIVNKAPDANTTFGAILGERKPARSSLRDIGDQQPTAQPPFPDSLENTTFSGSFP